MRALVDRVREAAEELGAARIAVVGGVAANSELRAALADAALAPLALTTDNAAMIASAARFHRSPSRTPVILGSMRTPRAEPRHALLLAARRRIAATTVLLATGGKGAGQAAPPADERRPAGAGSSARGRASRSASA